MVPQHLFTLLGIFDLYPLRALLNPVEDELRRCLADSSFRRTEFDIAGGGRGEPKRLRMVRDRPDQEPAAACEAQRPQRTSFGPLLEWDLLLDLPVLDDLDQANRVPARELGLDVELELRAGRC